MRIIFLGWTGALPTGVALLFAAIAGVLLVEGGHEGGLSRMARQARQSIRGVPATDSSRTYRPKLQGLRALAAVLV